MHTVLFRFMKRLYLVGGRTVNVYIRIETEAPRGHSWISELYDIL